MKGETLETVTTALVCLMSSQQTLLDYIPQLGYINKVFGVMSADNNAIPKAAIQLAHQFANNEVGALVNHVYLHLNYFFLSKRPHSILNTFFLYIWSKEINLAKSSWEFLYL